MIPDLGKYAGAVLGAYAVSIVALVLLVLVSLWHASRMKRALAEVEARMPATPDATTNTIPAATAQTGVASDV